MERLLTMKEVCQQLSLSDQTIRIYVRDGKIKALKLGGKGSSPWRFKQTDIDAYLKTREVVV